MKKDETFNWFDVFNELIQEEDITIDFPSDVGLLSMFFWEDRGNDNNILYLEV